MSGRAPSAPQLITIGVIRKAIGLEGACAVTSFGSSLEQLILPAEVCVGSSEEQCKRMLLEKIEFRIKGPVCFFSGISSMESAAELVGFNLFIEKNLLPELKGGALYHFELIGMKVQTDQGREIGSVIAVHNFPTIDSIEIDTRKGDSVMIPMSEEALEKIDRTSGFITLRSVFVEELL